MMTVRRQLLMTLLGVTDLVLVLVSFAVASSVTRGSLELSGLLEQSLSLREILLLTCYLLYWHIALASSGLYGSYRLATATRELRDIAVAGALAAAPLTQLAAMLGYPRVGIAFVAFFWALAVASLALGRRLLRGIGTLVRRAGRNLREVAKECGRTVGSNARRTRTKVVDVLVDHGYEPRAEGRDVVLDNCPFHALAHQDPELVCGMNLAFLEGVVDGAGVTRLCPRLEPDEARCCVRLKG